VLTASRAGIALLPLVLLAIWALVHRPLADLGRIRFVPALVILAGVALLVLWALRDGNVALAGVADRFVFDEEYRGELWRDAWFMAQRAWPAGIGLGGAEAALVAAERLEVLDPMLPNRVHNDYLELLLEGGLPAVVLLGAVVLVLAWRAWRTWRERPAERDLTALGLLMLFVVSVHSFVDYPLRSMALACLIGTGAGLLLPARRASGMSAAAADVDRAGIEGRV
jgi:O-antigen ligase